MNIPQENLKIIKEGKLKFNIQMPVDIKCIDRSIKFKYTPKNTKIILYKGTSNQAICYFNKCEPKMNSAVMNFANSHVVGGGNLSFTTQEEELCKTILDLYPSLEKCANNHKEYINFRWWQKIKYCSKLSLYRFDNMQSKGTYDFISNSPIITSVITAAAPNLSTNKSQIKLFEEDPNKIFSDIKNIIYTSYVSPFIMKNVDNINILILGAFGCGAFCPSDFLQKAKNIKYNEAIARLHIEVILETPCLYDYICFAIPHGNNYDAFKKILVESNMEITEIDG
jgi:uncharacterized protein (TIGR02452 family)